MALLPCFSLLDPSLIGHIEIVSRNVVGALGSFPTLTLALQLPPRESMHLATYQLCHTYLFIVEVRLYEFEFEFEFEVIQVLCCRENLIEICPLPTVKH